MSGQITHSWNGTVLTITSDAGTSSCDLKGDTGCRGPQGPHGIVYDAEGNIVMEGFATEQYVDDKLDNLDLEGYATEIFVDAAIDAALQDADFDGYATEEYVDTQIMNVATGGSIDMSKYATKDYVDDATANADIKIDGTTIVKNADGTISTAIGGGYVEGDTHLKATFADGAILNSTEVYYSALYEWQDTIKGFAYDADTALTICAIFADGTTDYITFKIPEKCWEFDGTRIEATNINVNASYLTGVRVRGSQSTSSQYGTYRLGYELLFNSVYGDKVVNELSLAIGYTAGGTYIPIDARFIPVDGETIIIQNGKLTVVGGTSLTSSEEVYY